MTAGLKATIGRFSPRKAIGVFVDEREVSVCHVALGPLGPVELASRTEPYEPDALAAVIEGLVRPLTAARGAGRPTVSIGLPALRVFFSTRQLEVTDRDATPNVLLHETLKSTTVNVEEMEVDLVRAQPGKKPLALLVAGRRKYLSGLLSAFEPLGVRPHRAEPAPFALLRLAAARHRAPRRARTVVRIFLGRSHGVAVLAFDRLPLAWRAFELPLGGEAPAVCAAARAIQIVARFRGGVGGCDAVFLHGRPDLAPALGDEAVRKALGAVARHSPDPAYDGQSVALGLALGAREGEEAFDLSRALKPKPSFWQIFPVGDVALQTAVLVCATLFLSAKYDAARDADRLVRAESAKHRWMDKVDDAKLEKEKKELEQKIGAVREFLESRILWTGYTRDTSVRLPESIVLRSLAGACELDMAQGGKVRGKKSLTLKLSTPIPRGQSMPREIDDYLNALRRDAMLQRDFPMVELADLKWNQPLGNATAALAEFTVNCLPADKPKPPPGGGAARAKASGH